MQTIAFVARKGGVSKTTLAAHLAVAACSEHHNTVLIDLDPQQSLAQWWNDREADSPALMVTPASRLTSELNAVKDVPGLVFIDTPGFDSGIVSQVIAASDLIVIPVRPSPHDFRAVAVSVEAIKKARKPYIFAVTQAVAGTRLTAQAKDVLRQTGPVAETVTHYRQGFAAAMTDGRTAIDIDPTGRAAQESTSLLVEVLALLRQNVAKSQRR